MTRVAIASSSQIAADAGAEVAEAGGNAVDAAIAASLVQLVTEPGVVSLGAGAFIVIWPAGGRPLIQLSLEQHIQQQRLENTRKPGRKNRCHSAFDELKQFAQWARRFRAGQDPGQAV